MRDLKLHEQLHEEEQDDSPAKAMMGNTKQNQTLQSTNTPDGVSPPTSHANESSGSLFDGNDDEDIFERRSMALVRKAASAAYEVALNYDDSEDERRGTNKKHIHRSINKINKRTRSGGDSDSDGEMELFETETPAAPLRDASVGHRAIVRSVIDDDDE